jgi:HK97 gp10 family phage protein
MIKGKATIEGIHELLKKFSEIPEQADKAIKAGVDRTALAMETDAKNKLKADGHIITGRLRASIHAELKPLKSFSYSDNKGNQFDGSIEEEFDDKLEAIVGTNVFYAPFIEFGTRHFSGDSFLGWASVKQEKLLRQRIEDELNKLIKKL